MVYNEYPTSAALSPFVVCFWTTTGDVPAQGTYTCTPSGYTDILFATGDARPLLLEDGRFIGTPEHMLNGLWTRPALVGSHGPIGRFGIRFKPEVFIQLFGLPMSGMENATLAVDDVFGTDMRELTARIQEAPGTAERIVLAEGFVHELLQRRMPRQHYLGAALDLLRGSGGRMSTAMLSERVHVSPRQLQRTFTEQLGISPKLYARLVRFNQAARLVRQHAAPSWLDITYDCGYADQAHFIREYKEFAGVTPARAAQQPTAVA